MGNTMKLVNLSYSNLNSIKKMTFIPVIIFVAVSIVNPIFLNMLIPLLCLNISQTLTSYEDTYGINYLISYIPVRRKEYVASRYVIGIINILISVCIFVLCYYLATKIPSNSGKLLDYKLTLGVGITVGIIGMSAMIPCVLKFGAVKGRMFMTFLVIGIVMLPTIVFSIAQEVEFMKVILEKLSLINVSILLIIINILIIYISYLVSKNLYCKKEIL